MKSIAVPDGTPPVVSSSELEDTATPDGGSAGAIKTTITIAKSEHILILVRQLMSRS